MHGFLLVIFVYNVRANRLLKRFIKVGKTEADRRTRSVKN